MLVLSPKRLSVAAILLVAFAAILLAARHWYRGRPPPPSAQSLQLAQQMRAGSLSLPERGFSLPYRLFVPEALSPGRLYPLVVYLHGAGDNGNDNVRQLGSVVAELLRRAGGAEPAFVLAPQAPWGRNWVAISGPPFLNYREDTMPQSDAIVATRALVSQLSSQYPVDPRRIYLLGFSAGSAGAWELLTREPTSPYAAAVLLSGAYDPTRAGVVAHLPLWFFHGEQDPISPPSTTSETVESLRNAGGEPRFTLCTGVGHDTSPTAVAMGIYDWLLSQRRPAPALTPAL